MHCPSKTHGRVAVAAFATAAFLTSASRPARSSKADFPPMQGAAKVEVRKRAIPAQVKTVEKKARVVVPDGVVEVRPAANLDQITKQMIEQLRPILRVELRLLTSAADPTPAQRREIAIEGGRTLKEVAGNMVGVRKGLNQAGRAVPAVTDPRKLIHDSIEAASRAKLSEEQFARYLKEIERKAQDRREVVMLNLVANLDKLLFLSVEQRTKLCESLRSHWDERTYPSLEMLVMYDAYFPNIPDRHISPILTEEQQKIWRGVQKINFASIRNSNFFNNGLAIGPADDEEDADVTAALAAEVKK